MNFRNLINELKHLECFEHAPHKIFECNSFIELVENVYEDYYQPTTCIDFLSRGIRYSLAFIYECCNYDGNSYVKNMLTDGICVRDIQILSISDREKLLQLSSKFVRL